MPYYTNIPAVSFQNGPSTLQSATSDTESFRFENTDATAIIPDCESSDALPSPTKPENTTSTAKEEEDSSDFEDIDATSSIASCTSTEAASSQKDTEIQHLHTLLASTARERDNAVQDAQQKAKEAEASARRMQAEVEQSETRHHAELSDQRETAAKVLDETRRTCEREVAQQKRKQELLATMHGAACRSAERTRFTWLAKWQGVVEEKRQVEVELEGARERFERELKGQREAGKMILDEEREAHRREIAAAKAETDMQKRMYEDLMVRTDGMIDDYKEQLGKVKECKVELKNMREGHEEEMSDAKERYERDIQGESNRHQQELAREKQKNDEQKARHEEAWAETERRIDFWLQKWEEVRHCNCRLEGELKVLKENHEKEIGDMRERHGKEMREGSKTRERVIAELQAKIRDANRHTRWR
ncbi:MAG: hypothetical protein M1831_006293 [Alyxoria varia]|nr:MAG: hypothetical protein M1831_006293 [Alyxoria varia]